MDEIKVRTERAYHKGYRICYGEGAILVVGGGEQAYQIYQGIKGRKSLSVYDGGYLIPLLSE